MCKQALHFKVFPIVGIPTPCYNYEELNVIGENYAERINQFQDNLIELCSKKEIIFVNFNSEINQDYFMEDGIHYNERGHIFIMKQLKERLQNLLKSF
jgi:lysophospholipase L1-like esterase